MAFGFGAFEKGIAFPITTDLSGMQKGLSEAQSELDKTASSMGKSMQNVGESMSSAGGSLTAGVTLPIMAIGTGAILAANDFDKAFHIIRSGTGATGDALDALKGDFEAVFKAVPAGAEDTATAIADLNTRLGVSGEELQNLSIQFLELSRITGTDVAGNIKSATRVFGDWNIANADASGSLDYLFRVSQQTGADVGQLSDQLVQYGAPMRQMGFDFETAAAMLGKFGKEGVNTELVLGSMRIALGTLARDGVTDTNEAFTMLVDNIKNAGSTGEANLAAIEAFGARAGPDMAAAIREGRFEFEDLISSLSTGTDTIVGVGEDTMGMEDKMTMLAQSLQTAIVPLGFKLLDMFETMMPTIEKVIDFVAGLIDKFTNLDPTIQTIIIAFAGVAAVLGPLLMVLGPIVTLVGTLMPFIPLLLGPIGLIIIAIGVVTGVLIYLEHEFGLLTKAAEVLSDGWKWLTDKVITPFVDWLKKGVDGVDLMGVALKLLLGPVGWVMLAMDHLGISWDDVWQGMISIAKGAAGFIGGIIDTMVGGIKWAVNMVIDGVNIMIRGLNMLKFDVPSWVPFIGGQSIGFNINQIPRLAAGGIVTEPTVAMIGEAGPEAIVPLDSRHGGGTGVGGITITGNTFNVRSDNDIKAIAQELQTLITRTNRGRGTL